MNTTMKGILLAGSLATLLGFTPMNPTGPGTREPAKVAVTNTRNVPVVVYLDREPLDIRLGTVPAHSEATLTLPGNVTAGESVRIVVDPAGGRELFTPDLEVKPGSTLMVLVPTNDTGFVPAVPDEVIPNPGPGVTTITVNNQRPEEVTLFLERGEFDVRLGVIPPNQEKTLVVPAHLVRPDAVEEVFIHPEHGLDLSAESVDLKPGSHVLLKVPTR